MCACVRACVCVCVRVCVCVCGCVGVCVWAVHVIASVCVNGVRGGLPLCTIRALTLKLFIFKSQCLIFANEMHRSWRRPGNMQIA